jgi:hypothetical protein
LKTLSWRPIVVLVVLLAALVFVLPTLQMVSENKGTSHLVAPQEDQSGT